MRRLVLLVMFIALLVACGGQEIVVPATATSSPAPTAAPAPATPTLEPTASPPSTSPDSEVPSFQVRELEELSEGWFFGLGSIQDDIQYVELIPNEKSSLTFPGFNTPTPTIVRLEEKCGNGSIIQIEWNQVITTTCLGQGDFLFISFFENPEELWNPTWTWFFALSRSEEGNNA